MAGAWHRLAAGAVACVAVALGLALGLPMRARADEALLPEETDEELVEDSDPTDVGVAPIGEEPDGTALSEELDTYLGEAFPESGLPGLAVAVVDADGVRYEGTYGDVTSDHQGFLIGSLSKSMCAVAVMQLVEQGRVDLDAPASTYAPGYAPSEVTVRSLLNQTSGFGYFESLADAQVGPTFGEFSYANANYDLLGRVVEGASGLSYGDYLQRSVFGPLGMEDATAGGEVASSSVAPGHRSWFGVLVADGFTHEQGDDAWGGPASGYVRASLSDMASYLQMYLNSGEGVLTAQSVHQMVFSRVPDPGGDTSYGFGWTTYRWGDGELVMSHDGQVENYVARMCVIPGRDLGVVVLCDANDEFGGNDTFFQIADDVGSIAVGGAAAGVDAGASAENHAAHNVAYLAAVIAAAAPLVGVALGTWRQASVASDVLLHLVVPSCLMWLPGRMGMRWRDFADFYPDQALVLGLCVALLVAGGAAKLACATRRRGEVHHAA